MKALLFLSIAWPMSVWGQTDTTLKPIQFREVVSGYGKYLHGTQIYSYDGIDVDNPTETLRKYILAIKDSSATHEYQLFQRNTEKIQGRLATLWVSTIIGTIGIVVGAIQNANYKNALKQQQNAYYSAITTTPTVPQAPTPSAPVCACQCWTGVSDNNGVTVYTCGSNSAIKTTNPFPGSTPTPTPTTQPTPLPRSAPTSVDMPNGVGWLTAGLSAYLLGTIVAASGLGRLNPGPHFLRSVQYYNRALNRKVSWQLLPTGGLNYTGLRVIGQF